MNSKTYTLFITFAYVSFGCCLLILPGNFLTLFGCPLDSYGEMPARTFAALLLGNAMLHYRLRNSVLAESIWQAILWSNILFNGLSGIIMSISVIQGIMNFYGLLPVALNFFICLYSLLLVKYAKPDYIP